MDHNFNPKKVSRRNFLNLLGVNTGIGLFQSPLQILVESIVLGAHKSALAATTGTSPRKFLHILQEGAPPRWTFDLFLTPYSSAGFVSNPQLGTVFNINSSTVSVGYSTISKKGIQVPNMWQYNIPAAGGGTRVMDPLLDNMFLMRGIQVGNPDHAASQSLQFVPLGASQSMSALSADLSSAPIPAVNMSLKQFQFKSKASKSAINLPDSTNMISGLLSPFTRIATGTFQTNRQKLGAALDTTINVLNAAADAQHPNAVNVSNSSLAARDLLSKGFGDLNSIWSSLYNKYSDIVTRALSPNQSLVGVNDKAIPSDGTTYFRAVGTLVGGNDIRSIITNSTQVYRLAAHFAVAEYVLLNNLSDSVAIAPGSLDNLLFNGQLSGVYADEHETSAPLSLLTNTFMNLAYAGCLIELIDQLKNKNLFNETVIVMGGEFGRNPQTAALGSDHGYMGSSSTIYCGALTGPIVLGNIYKNKSQDSSDSGTWGLGAPVAQLGRSLNQSDWASTVAFLLRAPSPTTAASSVLTLQSDGTYASLIELAKQI